MLLNIITMFCLNEQPNTELNKCILFTSRAIRQELISIELKIDERRKDK